MESFDIEDYLEYSSVSSLVSGFTHVDFFDHRNWMIMRNDAHFLIRH